MTNVSLDHPRRAGLGRSRAAELALGDLVEGSEQAEGATTLALVGLRGVGRLFRERYAPMIARTRLRRVLIAGAGPGQALARELHRRPELGMRVVGFLDADPDARGWRLGGIKVLGTPADLARVALRAKVELVLIPDSYLAAPSVRALVDVGNAPGLKVQALPRLDDLLRGAIAVRPRDVEIQDLLDAIDRLAAAVDGPTCRSCGCWPRSSRRIGPAACRPRAPCR